MLKQRVRGLSGLVLIILTAFLPNIALTEEVPVTLVEVQGNRRIEAATVLAKVKTREGGVFSPAQIKDDIRSLYQLGHFEDVQVRTEGFEKGLKVIFWVKEKPLIREISFEGMDSLSAENLKEVVTLLPRTAFNIQLIQENADKIRLKYQDKGYYHAVVIPVLSELKGGDKNVVFYIEEGEKVELSRVIIAGNAAISTEEIKAVMKNQEAWLFSVFGNSGTLRNEELKEDIESIRNLYYNRGYIQVVVSDPVIQERPLTEHTHEFLGQQETYYTTNEVDVRITVQEGEQFLVGSISLKGNTLIPGSELQSEIRLQPGAVFGREMMRQDVSRIMERYDSIARPFANVTPQFTIDEAKRTVAITIEIQEGGEVRIGRIDITGNIKTRDKVIRREIRLDEGELYSKKAIKRSYERINNLNFFEVVELVPERRLTEPVMDLSIKVKEKLTGSLSLGGGYSSVDKLMAVAEVSQGNLGGRGQLLKLKLQSGKTRSIYMLSFMEPYLLDKPVWGRVDVYNQFSAYDGYDIRASGFGLGMGKSYTEYVSASVRYSYDTSDILVRDLSKMTFQLKEQLESYGNMIKTSSMTFTLTRDSRDFYLDPKSGSRNSVFVTYAGGALGGDPNFVKTVGDSAWYFPVFWDTVIMARGRAGFAGSLIDLPLPSGERFYVGGSSTVRGYRYGTVGPVERSLDGTLVRVGGNKELIFNMEYSFPIVPAARLKGLLFYDIGKAFDESEPVRFSALRAAYGWGFWWLSPMGPLRFEWGYIINRKPTDQASQFEFSIGTLF